MAIRTQALVSVGALALMAASGMCFGQIAGEMPGKGSIPLAVTFDRLDQLVVTPRGRVVVDTAGVHVAHAALGPTDPAAGGYGGRSGCPQVSSLTDANFSGGSYKLEAGMVDSEMAIVSYTLSPASFPLTFRQVEMIFGTQNAISQTVTQWGVSIWQGLPSTGTLVAEIESDDATIPHIRIGPGTAGTNVTLQVDETDPDQIVITNDGSNTFSVGYKIVHHNAPTALPCLLPPASNNNAFPAVDVSGLGAPTSNWLDAINCGSLGCPPNGGLARFSQLTTSCRPTGDWVMRATWDPADCPGVPGACCTVTGGCVVTDRATCTLFGGSFAGTGTTCADLNGNGKADACEPAAGCPCTADFDKSGGTPDSTDIDAYFDAWLLGAPQADADCSGGTPDSTDISEFFKDWLAGGC